MKLIQSKIFCVALLGALTITACKSATDAGNSAQSGGGSTAKSSVAADADPKTVLINSMKSLQTVDSWVADIDNSSEGLSMGNAKMQVKYAAPDNFQIETETAGNKMQIISVGKDTFMQTGGKWQKAPDSVNMGQMMGSWREMFSDEKMAAFKNIESAGTETINGKELSVYTYEIDQQAAMPDEVKKQMTEEMLAKMAQVKSENRAKIWIDREKNLPARMEMTMKMSQPQQMTQKMAVNYRYDEAVKIEAPNLQ